MRQIGCNALTWIDILQPTPADKQYLAQHYPFHPLDLDDTLSRIQRSKIDVYREYLFIVLHFPVFNQENRVTVPSQVCIFIGRDYLITMHAGDLKPLTSLFRECQINEQARQENMLTSGYLLYRLTDKLVDSCLPILNQIMEDINLVEDDLFDPRTPVPIQDLSEVRRDVISYHRIAAPLRSVVASMERRTQPFVQEDMQVYWGDVNDHMEKIVETLDECKEIIEGLNDTGWTLGTHHTNEIIRVLTIISTIMLPLTLLASIYGMNVELPGANLPYFFLIVIVLMLAVIGGMLGFFHHHHWI